MSIEQPTATPHEADDATPQPLLRKWYSGLQTGVFDPVGRLVLLDAIFGALFIVRIIIPGTPLPAADTSALFLVAVCLFFRKPQRSTSASTWFLVVGALLLLWLGAVSFLQDGDLLRRLIRIASLMGVTYFIVDGRIDLRSLLFGLGLGLVANIGLFYAGLAPNYYVGALAGYLADKNVAGLYYALFTLILIGFAQSKSARWIILIVGVVAVYLTGSRTSMAGLAAGLVWIATTGRMPFVVRAMLGTLMYFALEFVEENFARFGPFQDRTGSDALRDRIDAATFEKVAQTPWYGQGLGTASVDLMNQNWFFHNSYAGLFVEGGVPFLVAMLGVLVFAIFVPRPRGGVRSMQRRALEAAAIAVLLCAARLGEVFITIPMFILLGMGLLLNYPAPEDDPVDESQPLRA